MLDRTRRRSAHGSIPRGRVALELAPSPTRWASPPTMSRLAVGGLDRSAGSAPVLSSLGYIPCGTLAAKPREHDVGALGMVAREVETAVEDRQVGRDDHDAGARSVAPVLGPDLARLALRDRDDPRALVDRAAGVGCRGGERVQVAQRVKLGLAVEADRRRNLVRQLIDVVTNDGGEGQPPRRLEPRRSAATVSSVVLGVREVRLAAKVAIDRRARPPASRRARSPPRSPPRRCARRPPRAWRRGRLGEAVQRAELRRRVPRRPGADPARLQQRDLRALPRERATPRLTPTIPPPRTATSQSASPDGGYSIPCVLFAQ